MYMTVCMVISLPKNTAHTPYIHTVYDRMYGDFPAKKYRIYTVYDRMYGNFPAKKYRICTVYTFKRMVLANPLDTLCCPTRTLGVICCPRLVLAILQFCTTGACAALIKCHLLQPTVRAIVGFFCC
jgi:hypothetical protein